MELKKILCAVDLMDSVNPAVEPAKHFARLTGASLTVLYILSSSASHLIEAPVEPERDDIRDVQGMSSRNSMMHAIWSARGKTHGRPAYLKIYNYISEIPAYADEF